MESMTRGDGWRFLDIGRRLERAIQMVELLRNGLAADTAGGVGVLEAILEMADSSITYRSRYLTSRAGRPGAGSSAGGRSQSALHRVSTGAACASISASFPAAKLPSGVPPRRASRCRCSIPCNSSMCAKWRAPESARQPKLAKVCWQINRGPEPPFRHADRAYFSHAAQSRPGAS